MSEQLSKREKRRELIITMSYSIFSILMLIVTQIEGWPIIYIPLIALNSAIVWWSYVTAFQSYKLRAFLYTSFMCIQVFLYGIWGENFNVLIPTLCVQFVIISLYEMTPMLNVAAVETTLLFLFHALYKHSFIIPQGHMERNRMMLQLVSFIVLIMLCYYRTRHHVQEESDFEDLENQVRMERKIKDDFVANTSHELRTPINTISGTSEILLQQTLPDDIHSSVLDIQMTSVELHGIITDILDYAALEADTLTLSPRPYSITSTLNDVMNMTVFDNKDKQLEIIFDCDPNIPRLLEGDEHQLRRVLNNLISNAIKFTSEGGVTVHVTYRPEKYGINLIVSVKDTGVGISLEEQEIIMRGFYQSDSDRNRVSSGMGLGLTISSALVKKMGGFLTVKSKPGEGSEFSFAIPQKVLDDQPCISLMHPGMINLIWYYRPDFKAPSMRDSFVRHIRHFSDYFGIVSHQVSSLEECKRRVAQGREVQIILGRDEYMEDREYFDELSEKLTIILVTEIGDELETDSHIHVLYKPYNAMMLAEIFNGRDVDVPKVKKERKQFIAPDAKILVVDDNLMNLKVVEGLLRKYKIKIVGAMSGEEALSIIDSRDFDFVFMDHMMPGMDGVECFHHIREKQGSYFKQVPIIALTANAIAGSKEMFLDEGFDDFIAKPIDSALMNEVLHKYIPIDKQRPVEEDKPAEKTDTAKKAEIKDKDRKKDKEKDKLSDKAKSTGSDKTEKTKPAIEKPAAGQEPVYTEEIFADMPSINKDTAIMYCGSAEDFADLAKVYCKTGTKYKEDLEKALKSGDLKNYGIIAHAIKSTSKTLGAPELAELALVQERAAKSGNTDEVRSGHEEFLSRYEGILAELKKGLKCSECDPDAAGSAEETSKGGTDAQEIENWDKLKAEMRSALESFETKAFEEIIEGVRGRLVDGRPVEDVLSSVLDKANNFDFEAAISELEKIGGRP